MTRLVAATSLGAGPLAPHAAKIPLTRTPWSDVPYPVSRYRSDEDTAAAWPQPLPGRMSKAEPPAHYEITVKGVLDPRWSAWFDGLQLTSDPAGRTTIAGPVTDQAALHGLLERIRDLGLPLLGVRCTDP